MNQRREKKKLKEIVFNTGVILRGFESSARSHREDGERVSPCSLHFSQKSIYPTPKLFPKRGGEGRRLPAPAFSEA